MVGDRKTRLDNLEQREKAMRTAFTGRLHQSAPGPRVQWGLARRKDRPHAAMMKMVEFGFATLEASAKGVTAAAARAIGGLFVNSFRLHIPVRIGAETAVLAHEHLAGF